MNEIALCNEFNCFVTLTFDPCRVDSFDYSECLLVLSQKLRQLRRYCQGFKYVLVPELHASGAYHFHGLLLLDPVGFYVPPLIPKRFGDVVRYVPNTRKYLSHSSLDFVFRDVGHYSVSMIRSDSARCTSYMTSYVAKTLHEAGPSLFGRHLVLASSGLAGRELYYEGFGNFSVDGYVEMEYCYVKWYQWIVAEKIPLKGGVSHVQLSFSP